MWPQINFTFSELKYIKPREPDELVLKDRVISVSEGKSGMSIPDAEILNAFQDSIVPVNTLNSSKGNSEMESVREPVIIQSTVVKSESEVRSLEVDASAVPTDLRALDVVGDSEVLAGTPEWSSQNRTMQRSVNHPRSKSGWTSVQYRKNRKKWMVGKRSPSVVVLRFNFSDDCVSVHNYIIYKILTMCR